jgi:hypothetical protein
MKQVGDAIQSAAEAVDVILKEGIAAAMNRFNRKPDPPEESE